MRMKNTMPPYPGRHVQFYNGSTKVIREDGGEFVEFDETANRTWERQLWQEGFRPLDEGGNVIMRQSTKSAPMRNLNVNAVVAGPKESIDPGVLAENNAEFQELHADQLKQFEENAKLAAEGKVVDTNTNTVVTATDVSPAARNNLASDPKQIDRTTDAGAFGLTEEEAAAQTQSNSVDPADVKSGSSEDTKRRADEAVERMQNADDDDKPAPRRRKKAEDDDKE